MAKWEYKSIYEDEFIEKRENINQLGNEGWELTGIQFHTVFKQQHGTYIFKRKRARKFLGIIIQS